MQKQQVEQQDGFVSFMLEKDDSQLINPDETFLKESNNQDYYLQLSRQFYGQSQRKDSKYVTITKATKSTQINPGVLKQKIIQRVINTNAQRGKFAASVPTVSEQLQKVLIQKLLSSSKPKKQPNIQTPQNHKFTLNKYISQIKNSNIQQHPFKLNLPVTNKKINIYEPRTHRLRIEDSNQDQFNQFTQNSHRSTLNSSTKSTTKLEKNYDISYPIKTEAGDDNKINIFKISYRNKQK
ncbi:unnamed protein product (macronuclear) [Paramecium tetraurelia]|uniref:Uncharacterized protein n=1 Tax=Paramecium tetraurelia TaxID=5888 RepID=A0D9G2_PARTE|nr:uncharacterized protein GSPATT00014609001 [Paramecium tetraurelia]CAK79679.1 unnamed protein product [Paramecium tetraurelia]|eukprot:XP_001447076.1 hypothetical protein (macronuclear) [Paramecium tetraurelia strain d4-2]